MSKNSQRYANAVKLQYLNYEERKKKGGQRATDYLKHKPSYFTIIPEFVDDMGMLILDNENNELIYSMRGLDFNAIKQDAPYAIAGGISGADVGGRMGQGLQGVVGGRGSERFASAGKLLGAGVGSYLTGNNEIRTALDIILSGVFNQQLELDEETQQVKQGLEKRFMNEYINDLNRELIKIRDIQNTFPNTKILLAGHSRGAKKAEDLSKMLDLEAYMFNPAESNVLGNLLLQAVVPMFFANSGAGSYIESSIAGIMEDSVSEIQRGIRENFEGSGGPLQLSPTGEAAITNTAEIRPYGSERGQIYEYVQFGHNPPGQAALDVDNPMMTPPRQARPLTGPLPAGRLPTGEGVMNIEYRQTSQGDPISPAQQVAEGVLQEYIRQQYPILGSNAFNSIPTLNRFLEGQKINFDSPINIGTEGAMVQTALGMNNAPVSLKTILEAAARYSATRYGGGLIKYSLEKAAGEETMATQLLANPFTLVSLASLSASVINPNERIEVTDPNLNIYRTKDDLVSRGYSDKYNVEDKAYVPTDLIQRLIIGKHSIDQFTTIEMFDSTSQNRKINDERELQSLSATDVNQKGLGTIGQLFNRDVRERKGSMSELMNKDVRKQPKLIPKQQAKPEPPKQQPPKSQFNIIMPTPPKEQKPVEPHVYQEFKGQDFMGGTPSFQAINPYYLCKQYPNLPGCQDFIE